MKFPLAALIATAVLPMGLLSACATSEDGDKTSKDPIAQYAEDSRLGEEVKRACFARNIDGFGETTRRTVVLTRGVRDDYLVTVMGGCFNLEHAQSIGVDSRGGSCLTRGDALIVSESAFSLNDGGLGPDRCIIDRIYKWDSRAKAKAADDKSAEDGDMQDTDTEG